MALYRGFVVATIDKTFSHQMFPLVNTSEWGGNRKQRDVSDFLHHCRDGRNFIEALGIEKFYDAEHMNRYNVHLELEPKREVLKHDVLKTLQIFYVNLENHRKEVTEYYNLLRNGSKDEYLQFLTKERLSNMKALPERYAALLHNRTDLLDIASQVANQNFSTVKFGEVLNASLLIANDIEHPCKDLVLLWFRGGSGLFHDFSGPTQGVWFLSVFIGILAIISFVITVQMVRILNPYGTSGSTSKGSKGSNSNEKGSDRERLLNERDGPPQSAYTNPMSNNVMVEPPMSMQRDAHLPAGGNRQQDAGSYMDNLLKTNKDPFDSLMKQPNAKSTNPIDSYLGQITDKPDKPKPKNTKEGAEKNKTKRNDVKSGKSGKTKHKDVNAGKSDKSKNKKTKKRDEGSAKKEPKTKHKAPETKRISPPAKDKSTQESAPNK